MHLTTLATLVLLIAATGATAGIVGASRIDDPQLQYADRVLQASFVLGQTDVVIRVHMLSPFYTALIGGVLLGMIVALVCRFRRRDRSNPPPAR